MKKKYISALLILAGVLFLRCNAAPDGFNAPDGSTIAFTSTNLSETFSDKNTASDLFLITVKVTVNIGVTSTTGTGTGTGDTTTGTTAAAENANDIAGSISCGVCTLYVFKSGVTTFLPLASLVDPVAGSAVSFKTNSQGLYTFVASIPNPAAINSVNSSGQLVSYTDSISADIGVSNAELTMTANVATTTLTRGQTQ